MDRLLTSTRFAFFGGVPKAIVCDNLKAGVTTACRYEPGVNRTYQDMATHYGTAVLPTRVRRPRDKAKVEVAVQVVQRWVLARLRDRRFFSLAELNGAIRVLVDELNARPMRQLGASRRALFEAIERPALLALPSRALQYAEWRRCRVGLGLPRRGARAFLLGAVPADPPGGRGPGHAGQTVEVFHRGVRVASHARSPVSTAAHDHPRAHAERAPPPCRLDAGASARAPPRRSAPPRWRCARQSCAAKPHPEQGFRACLGILAWPVATARPPRGGLPPRSRHRRSLLRLDCLDPAHRPRPGLLAGSRTGRRPSGTATSAAVATTTEEETPCSPTPPANGSRPSGLLAWPRPSTISGASRIPQRSSFEVRLALLVDREVTERDNKRLVARLKFAGLRQAASSRTSICAHPRPRPRFLRQARRRRVDRAPPEPARHRPDRHRQDLARLRPRPQGMPRQSLRALPSRAAAARGPRRWHAATAATPACSRAWRGCELLILDDWDSPRSPPTSVATCWRSSTTATAVSPPSSPARCPVDHWHEHIGNPTIADAVLDRLVHNAHRLELNGDSMRKITAQTTNLDAAKKP